MKWSASTRTGLSLVELLAAVIVLSIVAATGVSIVREVRRAQNGWQYRAKAIEVLERWRAEHSDILLEDELALWVTTDGSGTRWQVSIAESREHAPEATQLDRRLRTATRRVTVQRSDSRGVPITEYELDVFANSLDEAAAGGTP